MTVTIACGLTILSLIIALFVGFFYFDLSWDGQWYQQAAVYELADNWNPITKPLLTPDHSNHTSILHFPKSTWYFGASVLRTFGNVEMGKAYNIIVLFATSGVVYAFFRDLGLTTLKSILLTILTILNPVVWSEITTYLNDGNLYLLLVAYLAAIILWLRTQNTLCLSIALLSVCCLVNAKFTGLVFFLTIASFLFIYVLIRQRILVLRFVFIHVCFGVLAVGIFGFNPYMTNLINRGHPLYPLMGTKAYPSVFANGGDDNEAYETPQNMRGKNLPIRLLYANFGKPGNAPYNGENGAKLVSPLNVNWKSWTAYYYHETRISGFGPYFGILLLLSAISLFSIKTASRLPTLIWLTGLICCLSLSKHFWWPRLFPMLWLFPILPLALLWLDPQPRYGKIYSYVIAGLIGINGLIVAVIHIKWETESSIALKKELNYIQNKKKPIIVEYGWFKRSVEEKLRRAHIPFTAGPLLGPDSLKRLLPSVVEGYPNQVIYQFQGKDIELNKSNNINK